MGVNAFGTDQFLKYQIRNRIEHIKKDDQVRPVETLLCVFGVLTEIPWTAHSFGGRRVTIDIGTSTCLSISRCPYNGRVPFPTT